MNNSIMISDKKIDKNSIVIPVPWQSNSAAHNMVFPEQVINIAETPIDSLDFSEVESLYVTCNLKESEYGFLNKMLSAKEIYLYKADELKSLDFIKKMVRLRSLFIGSSRISDISPLVELLKLQEEKRSIFDKKDLFHKFEYSLSNFAVVNSEISDLSPLKNVKARIEDFCLRYNQITDLSPLADLGIYYANFSHNNITDLESFMNHHKNTYFIYIRWNNISSIEFMRGKREEYRVGRFFVNHNSITDYSPTQDYYFVVTDIPGHSNY